QPINSSDLNGNDGILEKLKVDKNRGLDSSYQHDLDTWKAEQELGRTHETHRVAEKAAAVNDNRVQDISVVELLVSDICVLKAGDVIPADGLIIEGSDLVVDEIALIGEDGMVSKNVDDDIGL
ncbi:unnamed protein product, partial [Adineta ricciae]